MTKQNILSIDTETTIEPQPRLRVITVKESSQPAKIIYNYYDDGEFSPIKHKHIKDYIESFDVVVIHNAAFDIPVLNRNHIFPKKIWDTMVAEFLLSGGELKRLNSYKDLVYKYSKISLDKTEQKSDWSTKLTEEQIKYCYEDVNFLQGIAEEQKKVAIHCGSLGHIVMKNEVIRLCSTDFMEGYPIDTNEVPRLKKQCLESYREAFSLLLSKLPLALFYKGNFSKKLMYSVYADSFPYHAVALPAYSPRMKLEDIVVSDSDLKQFFLENPHHEILVTIASPSFAGKLLTHYGIKFETTDKEFLKELMDEPEKYGVNEELIECLQAVMKAREVEKVQGTYLDSLDDLPTIAGQKRIIPKLSYTVSGRLTIIPYATLPKGDDNKTELQNAVRDLYIPPTGYTTLSSDYKSAEDINGAFYFGEKDKVRYVEQGFDLYLLLAAKVFKNFEYTSSTQTSELKKKYKSFRQAVKAISLAKNYSAGKNKIYEMYLRACDKQGIAATLSAEDLENAWAELYPKLAKAQRDLSDIVSSKIESLYDHFDLSEEQIKLLSVSGFDNSGDAMRDTKARKANSLRKQLLTELNMKLMVSSILGLKRIYNVDYFNKIKLVTNPQYPNKVSVTEISNYTTQASGSDVIGLALIMIKKLYPSIIIPTIVHDSVVCFVPSGGIDKLSLDDIKDGIKNIMSYANYLVYGKAIGVDSEYMERGF